MRDTATSTTPVNGATSTQPRQLTANNETPGRAPGVQLTFSLNILLLARARNLKSVHPPSDASPIPCKKFSAHPATSSHASSEPLC